jgi:hypothetical protein
MGCENGRSIKRDQDHGISGVQVLASIAKQWVGGGGGERTNMKLNLLIKDDDKISFH